MPRVSLPLKIALSLLSRPGVHRYGEDPSQVAELHLPSGPGPHPVAVVLHGGYWQTQYGKLICRPLARSLASRGYAAWNLEYRRLGDGRGGGGGWPMTFQDVADGIDALADLSAPVDLTRVTLVGHSAGGQLALWAAARPSLPATAVGAAPRVVASRVLAVAVDPRPGQQRQGDLQRQAHASRTRGLGTPTVSAGRRSGRRPRARPG